MAWIPLTAATTKVNRIAHLGDTAPNPANFGLILCLGSGTLTEASVLADFTTAELATANGYTGRILLTGGAETFDGGQARSETTWDSVLVSASGGDLTYDTAVIMAEVPTAGDYTTAIPWIFEYYGSSQVIADGQSTAFNVQINLGKSGTDVETI